MIIIMKRGKTVKSEGIELPNDEKIRSLKKMIAINIWVYYITIKRSTAKRKHMKDKVGKECKGVSGKYLKPSSMVTT